MKNLKENFWMKAGAAILSSILLAGAVSGILLSFYMEDYGLYAITPQEVLERVYENRADDIYWQITRQYIESSGQPEVTGEEVITFTDADYTIWDENGDVIYPKEEKERAAADCLYESSRNMSRTHDWVGDDELYYLCENTLIDEYEALIQEEVLFSNIDQEDQDDAILSIYSTMNEMKREGEKPESIMKKLSVSHLFAEDQKKTLLPPIFWSAEKLMEYYTNIDSSADEVYVDFHRLNDGHMISRRDFVNWVEARDLLPDHYQMNVEGGIEHYIGPWTIEIRILDTSYVKDTLMRQAEFHQILAALGYWVPVFGLLCGLFYLILTWMLFCGFGHKKGVEGIAKNWSEGIPLEIAFLLAGTLACGMAASGLSLGSHMSPMGLGFGIGLCCLAYLVGLWFLRTLLVRCKAKCLASSSLCVRFLIWLKEKIWRRSGGVLLIGMKRGSQMLVSDVRRWNAGLPYFRKILFWYLLSGALEIAFMSMCGFHGSVIFFVWIIERLVLLGLALNHLLDYAKLKEQSEKLAAGELTGHINPEDMATRQAKEFADSMNHVQDGIEKALEERVRSERMRTELITNVSHDIKTPLTSIINYVDFLKKEELPEGNVTDYVKVLDRQSIRLKKLIEDLLEASKASTGNLEVNLASLDLDIFLNQVQAEYEERLETKSLDLIVRSPEQPVSLMADGRHLWRVFDNLFGNIVKYAMPGTRIYLDVEEERERKQVLLTLRNISALPIARNASELTERFTRGDSSRTTEGSGLGLAICQSLMELQGGKMEIVCDGDLFKVILTLDAGEKKQEEE